MSLEDPAFVKDDDKDVKSRRLKINRNQFTRRKGKNRDGKILDSRSLLKDTSGTKIIKGRGKEGVVLVNVTVYISL